MERRSVETMALNQFTRRQFKRRAGTGRITTNRPISFDKLLLSGKKPVPPATSNFSLYENISTTLKENVDPEPRIAQNVDDFWAAERKKRVSAVARRKLTGEKASSQEVSEQPVEDRKARHARSRRVGGSRTVGAKRKKLDVYIDAGLIADWDEENLEVEEEKPCTIASSEAFMSAQETALRASLKVQTTMDHGVEAVPGTGSPTHSKGNACRVGEEPQAQTPRHYHHATIDAKSASGSLKDMDLSSGESPDCLTQNVMNPHDCTPNLASLVEMDWNTSCPPRPGLENALNSRDTLRGQAQDTAGPTVDTKRLLTTFFYRLHVHPDKPRGDCLVADSRADRPSLVPTVQLRPEQFEQEGRVNEDQGCMSSLPMNGGLDKDVSCANRDRTPFHDAQCQKTRVPTTSPTPPSNPFAVYMSRRQLLNETGELSQRKLAFGNCSPSSSLDISENYQVSLPVDDGENTSKSCDSQPCPPDETTVQTQTSQRKLDFGNCSPSSSPDFWEDCQVSLPVDVGDNNSKSATSQQCPPDDITAETQTCVDLQSQPDDITADTQPCTNPKSQADNVTAEKLQLEPRQQSEARKVQNKWSSLEDVEVEAALDAEEAELLIEEPRAAPALRVRLLVDVETQTCGDLHSQPDDIEANTQPCTNPESHADNVTAQKLQLKPRQPSQAKKPTRRKVQNKRSSLEGSENGCTWIDGQRRSQRRRVRPLEWWRGEKLLYGRVHESLTTVIGIKQSSPGHYARGIAPSFVIESYVSAEFDDLVAFAAL